MLLKQTQFNWKVVAIIIISTLILSVDRYRYVFRDFRLDHLIYYLVLPLLVILLVLRESPAEYGFRLGNWRTGMAWTALAVLGITLVLPFISRLPDFREYYSSESIDVLPLIVGETLSILSWEFFFRGFLLFALLRIAGPHAIWLQAVPFTLAHFGKPEVEVLSCIFGGAAFGYIAWHSRSFLYPFIIHTYLAVMIIYLCS